MGSSKKQTVGYRYYMGLHFGLCHGPVDQVQQVKAGDREAWAGAATDSTTISINQGELFGGDKKEGGISGSLDILMGGAAQGQNGYLASKISAAIPAFRGILSAVWRGGQVSANNPYVKPWSFRVQRILQGWAGGSAWHPAKAKIGIGEGGTPEQVLPESLLVSVWAWRRDTTAFDKYDIARTSEPTFASYFGEFGSSAMLNMTFYTNGTAPGDSGTLPAKTLPIDVTRDYILAAVNGFWSGDIADAQFEFLNESGGVVAAIVTLDAGAAEFQHFLRYGPSLGSLTTVSQNVGSIGTINFSAGLLSFTKFAGTNLNGSFTLACDALSIRSVRVSGVRVLGTYAGGANDPYAYVRLQKAPKTIPAVEYQYFSMNPAHIVYECLTNSAWGMGYPASAIDEASFTAAADTLFAEGFGLCMVWNKQDSLESFIKVVLDHAGGILYVSPSTGRFAIKLIRADYDRNTLPQFGPSNLIGVSDFQRQAWGETVNEVTVVYRDWQTNKDAAVTIQDLANIQTQGGVVSQSRQYPGIPEASLAQRVAMRDLDVVSTPLAKARITANRNAWNVIPGGVFRLTWPDYGVDDVVFRVLEVNTGTLQNGQIQIEAVEDVFGMPSNTYAAEQAGAWEDPSSEPAPAPFRKLVEAPYWDLALSLSAADLDYLDPLSGYVETLAARPSGDAVNYEINSKTGAAEYQERAIGEFCPTATLAAAITKTTTAITFEDAIDVDLVAVGGYAMIGDEYIGVSAIDIEDGTATITRGLLDTVPADHAAGARIWFSDGFVGSDPTEYATTEVVDVKLLPRTGKGELAIGLAPSNAITMARRHNRPYAPGNVRVGGVAYPEWIGGTDALALTWAHRDRLSQTAYLVQQSEASIGPEAGTTYTLRIYDEADILKQTASGLSSTSYTYTTMNEIVDNGDAGDPLFSSVSLLLHMNGSNGSTTFTDSSGNPKTVTPSGNAQISTAQSRFGGASGLFDASGDYLTVSPGISFASGDFTAEWWVYYAADLSMTPVVARRSGASGYLLHSGYEAGNLRIVLQQWTTGGIYNIISASTAHTLNTWVHVCIERVGDVITLYTNGVSRNTLSTANRPANPGTTTQIGQDQGAPGATLNGYIDELRITTGVARYTANFTPPAAEFLGQSTGDSRLNGRLRFELESVRDGLTSYQRHNHEVRRKGYGFNYGMNYGGQ